jgi:hypothetical protein
MRYHQLHERVLNLLSPEQKEQIAPEVWDLLQLSYEKVGGFKSAASPEELIQKSHLWKAVRRNGKITAVSIYKDHLGRKSIASGTDGSTQGKKDYGMLKTDDLKLKRAWAEVSGPVEKIMIRGGAKPVSNKLAAFLTGKEIMELNPDGHHYTRRISGEAHEKIIFGFVHLDADAVATLTAQGIDLHDLPDNIQLSK